MKTVFQFFLILCPAVSAGALAQTGAPLTEYEELKQTVRPYLEKNQRDVQQILRGLTGLEVTIYFRTDSAVIDRFSALQIYNVAKIMALYPMVRIRIEGFTDVRGSKVYNKALSERRVEAVKRVLFQAERGLDPGRIYSHGYGGEWTAQYKRGDPEGMFYERRVTIGFIVHRPLVNKSE
jgi:outer membrane protein OmpA-like peptidoglycan-associated protein